MLPSNKFIINVCLTGNVPTRAMNPYLPVTPEEIARDVKECLGLGASIFHIHARDKEGRPDWRRETYQAIADAVRTICDEAIICVSTSGRKIADIEKRLSCLDITPRPDMASLTLGSVDFWNDSVTNSPSSVRHIISVLHKKGIVPEIEVFDSGMARTLVRLLSEGILETPCFINVVLGNAGSADASPIDLAAILQRIPPESVCCFAGIGKTQLAANILGLIFAHGVRVGLEDNIYLDDKKTLAKNSWLVERIVKIGNLMGKSPLTISETRSLLKLRSP